MKDIKARGRVWGVTAQFDSLDNEPQSVEVVIRFEGSDAKRIPGDIRDVSRWVDVTISPVGPDRLRFRTVDGEVFDSREKAEEHSVEKSKTEYMTRKQIAESWVRGIREVGS